MASQNFCGKSRTDFVLWHFNDDGFTIDGRYPLNDEPNVVFNILQNYSSVYYGDKYILFQTSDDNAKIERKTLEKFSAKFNEWIDVPDCGDNIQRIKVWSEVNFTGLLKKTFLKDEIYYIDYLTSDNELLTYRYVPSTAVDGLWVNPFVTKFPNGELAGKIVKLRFRNSNNSCVAENISVQFEIWNMPLKNI